MNVNKSVVPMCIFLVKLSFSKSWEFRYRTFKVFWSKSTLIRVDDESAIFEILNRLVVVIYAVLFIFRVFTEEGYVCWASLSLNIEWLEAIKVIWAVDLEIDCSPVEAVQATVLLTVLFNLIVGLRLRRVELVVVCLSAWVKLDRASCIWTIVSSVESHAPANVSWVVQNGMITPSLQTKGDLKVWLAQIEASIMKLVKLRPVVNTRIPSL